MGNDNEEDLADSILLARCSEPSKKIQKPLLSLPRNKEVTEEE